MKTVVGLADATSDFGGKAHGLSNLITNGLPVPPGLAVHPNYMGRALQESEVYSSIKGFLNPLKKYAVRSSAIGEDGESYSYAGIYDTLLNVPGNIDEILLAIEQIKKSGESDRLLTYSASQGVEGNKKIGVVIQEMINPEIAGVAFSSALGVDGMDKILIEFTTGLADKLVSGEVKPTRIEVPYLNGDPEIENSIVSGPFGNGTGLDKLVSLIQKASNNLQADLDIEWAIDKNGEPWLLQARPITKNVFVPANSLEKATPASPGIAKGNSFVIEGTEDLYSFPQGGILVAQVTETSYLPAMNRAAAVVTEEGGMLSHAAIVCRELQIPCIVGYPQACSKFPTGTPLVVDGSSAAVKKIGIKEEFESISTSSIDWGSAYLFENLIPVNINGIVVLVDPTPTGLVVHIPEDISSEDDEKLEIFCRKEFSASPRRYKSDKYLWFFEWNRFSANPYFVQNLKEAKGLVENLDIVGINAFYDKLISEGEVLIEKKKKVAETKIHFLIDESLLSSHFLLTMLIPEGYALRKIYSETIGELHRNNISFPAFLGMSNVGNLGSEKLERASTFSRDIATRRNNIYATLVNKGLMRDDYFEDREERAITAISLAGGTLDASSDPIDFFYRNLIDFSFSSFLSQGHIHAFADRHPSP